MLRKGRSARQGAHAHVRGQGRVCKGKASVQFGVRLYPNHTLRYYESS